MTSLPPFVGDGSLRAALASGVHARAFEEELILLHAESGDYFALNEIGRELLRGLEDGYSLEECARRLHATYDADWPTLCSDILELSRELLSRKLIVLRTSSPAAVEASS